MKNSEIIVKIDMGVVLDETRMTREDLIDMLFYTDLNYMVAHPVAHILRDVDTDEITLIQDLQTGLNAVERYIPE